MNAHYLPSSHLSYLRVSFGPYRLALIFALLLLPYIQTISAQPNAGDKSQSPGVEAIQQKLNQKIDVEFGETETEKVIDLIARKLDVKIEVDWKSIEVIGVVR